MLQDNGTKTERQQGGQHNGITMLFCVLAAICIWFYVMSVDSQTTTETFSSVPVQIVNQRDPDDPVNLTAISGSGNVIEVVLKGRKKLLGSISSDSIEAYVDVSDVHVSGKGSYDVVVEAPAGTVIEEFYPAQITVYMDEKGIVTVPVRCKLADYTVGSEFSLDTNPTLSVESVRVTGPESELEDVAYAQMILSPGKITQSFSGSASLQLVDNNGTVMTSRYLTLSDKEAKATYNVYTTKQLTLSLNYRNGWFAENGTSVTVTPTTVKVRGLVEKLNALTDIAVATIDEQRIMEDGTYNYSLTLPDGVEPAGGQTVDAVSVHIEFRSNKMSTVTVPASRIKLTGIPDGKQVQILDDTLKINVRGSGVGNQYLTADMFDVAVDLGGTGNGDQYVPATVSVRSGNSAALYPVGDYVVQVRVADK